MIYNKILSAAALILSGALEATASGDEHAFEWGGMFEVTDENFIWVSQKVDGAYADSTMAITVVPTDSTSEDDFEAAEEVAEALLEAGGCTAVAASGTITPSSTSCFEFTFDDGDYETKYTIDTSALSEGSGLAIYTEHLPSEFESDSHYLRDEEGHDVEAVHATDEDEHADHEDEDEGEGDAPLGMVILGCFVVNLVTFAGVAVMACSAVGKMDFVQGLLQGFSSGALLACAAFLMIIESVHMIMAHEWTDDADEVEVAYTWRWGTALLAGFIAPITCHFVFSLLGFDLAHHMRGAKTEGGVEMAAVKGSSLDAPSSSAGAVSPLHSDDGSGIAMDKVAASSALVGICIGDFMHNFTDGVLIGTAFKLCSSSVAWGIIVGTCTHEVAQEIADYVLLTSAPVNLSPVRALAVNFLVGLSCVLGGIVVHQTDVSNGTLGLMLAFGAGTYIYLGASVGLTAAFGSIKTTKDTAGVLCAFILGAIAIGLILLNHDHCESEEGDGHGH